MWFAQLRVWAVHPPAGDLLRMLAAVHYKSMRKQPKRPPKKRDGPTLDMRQLDEPLTDSEIALLMKRGKPVK
jgi:hypothetical protein